MKQSFSAQDLAQSLGITARAVQLRAKEELWPATDEIAQGGRRKLYAFSGLPKDIKDIISSAWARENASTSGTPQPEIDNEGALVWQKLSERDQQLAIARNDLLSAANAYKKNSSKKRVQRLTEFYALLGPAMRDRNMGALADLGLTFDKALRILTHVVKASLQTHYRWEANCIEAEKSLGLGLIGLIRIKREAHGYGARTLSAEMIAHARKLILKAKVKLAPVAREEDGRVITLNRKLLFRRLSNHFGAETMPSYANFTRWVNAWLVSEQYDLTAIALPQFHRAAFGIDGGCASGDCYSAGQRWEVDGSPADVMLKDGRYELLAAIDIFSRDAVVEVSKTASAITVARLYYRGMLRWGVPSEIVMDNGSIFVSAHMMGAHELLKIDPVLCRKYTPDDKPHVERFFGTLTKMLFEGMTWYCGHDPKQRKRIDEYKNFNQVFYCRKGEKISCDATADELRDAIENWLEKVYRAEEHRFADVKLGRSRFILDRLANSPERAGAIKNAKALEDILSPPFERVFNSSRIDWLDVEYRPASQEDFERSLKYGKQKVIFRPNISDISGGTLWQEVSDGDGKFKTGDFICRLTSNVTEQTIEAFSAARKTDRKRQRDRKKAVETIFAPSYERELADMPMPKVACANFGAVEYDGPAYRNLSGYKSEPMPDAPGSTKSRLTEATRSAIRLELADKEKDMEALNPVSKTNGNGCNGNVARKHNGSVCEIAQFSGAAPPVNFAELDQLSKIDQYEKLMELEIRGMEIPKQYLSSMRYFEASTEYARSEEYFERKKAMLAAQRRKS